MGLISQSHVHAYSQVTEIAGQLIFNLDLSKYFNFIFKLLYIYYYLNYSAFLIYSVVKYSFSIVVYNSV